MPAERTVILMYHRVLPDEPTAFGTPSCYRLRGTAVTPIELRSHLDFLAAQRIPVVTLAEVVAACAQHEPPPPGVVLTFDDGYAEWTTKVAPELRARRLPASFFISSGIHADMTRAHPIDEYYFLLDNARQPKLSVTLPDGQSVTADLRVPKDKRELVYGPLKHFLVRGTATEQAWLLSVLKESLAAVSPIDLPAVLYLPRAGWSQLAQCGSRVEAHGHRHRRLTELTDAEIDSELISCLASLTEFVEAPRHFAYPDGACDARVAVRVTALGLCCALTVVAGPIVATSDLFFLPRYFVRSETQLATLLG